MTGPGTPSAMLQIRDIHYAIGGRRLLTGVSWAVQPGGRTALIGPNGTGKTTLFKIVIGELAPDRGEIVKPRDYRIGYLPQEEVAAGKGSVLATVLAGREELLDLEEKISLLHRSLDKSPENPELLKQVGNLEQEYEALGGYRVETTAKSILSGLGIDPADFTRPLAELSGGWRMRVYLARLLIQEPDLLLLDEPTNHFDLPSLEWLEQYLAGFSGSIVLVSHDRYFIDRLAREVHELERGTLDRYAGNYHFYEVEKPRRLELLRKKYEENEAERRRQERFISRNRARNDRAAQVQSRIRQLEKMEKIELPPPPRTIDFQLSVEVKSYKDVLVMENLGFGYEENRWVFRNLNLHIYRGDRVCLVGPNGEGKTTLTRLIAGEREPRSGSLRLGKRTAVGYYAQHQVEALDLEKTVYDEVASTVAERHATRIRTILGLFQLSGDDVFKPVKVLSGGEKARVSLAKMLLSPVNFLVMDEPTNHLDLASREALEQALTGFDGTLLLISHDRYFLDKIVNRVVEFRNGKLHEYVGNYTDYLAARAARPPQEEAESRAAPAPPPPGKKTREQKRIEAEARQAVSKRRTWLRDEINHLEEKIHSMETRRAELVDLMARPETYQDGKLFVSLQKEYTTLERELPEHEQRWEKAHLELEEIFRSLPGHREKESGEKGRKNHGGENI